MQPSVCVALLTVILVCGPGSSVLSLFLTLTITVNSVHTIHPGLPQSPDILYKTMVEFEMYFANLISGRVEAMHQGFK